MLLLWQTTLTTRDPFLKFPYHAKVRQLWREAHAEHFALAFLPPCSPDLNRIERVWKLTRRHCLHNRCFKTIEMVVEAVESAFAQWVEGNETLRRLCVITQSRHV